MSGEGLYAAVAAGVPTQLAVLIDDVERFIRRFVSLTEAQAAAVALWVVLSYSTEAFEVVPYLNIHSALKRSGKTLLLEILAVLVRRPMLVADMSAAVLFRAIDERRPALLFDEVDVIFGGKSERADELRGLLNAGYKRGGVAMRVEMRGKEGILRDFDVFGPKALAGIGELPDTISDRAIPIEMLRQVRSARVERFRTRGKLEETAPVREQMAAWATEHLEELAHSWPPLPDELNDRQQDIWEPMLAIADLAGPEWGMRARAAARELHGAGDESDTSVAVLLLGHLRDLFAERGDLPALATETILEALVDRDDGPWPRWWSLDSDHGRRSAASALARQLKPFGIKSTKIKVDGVALRGYRRESLDEAWARYLPPEMEPTPTDGTPQVAPTSRVPSVSMSSVPEGTLPGATSETGATAPADAEPSYPCDLCGGRSLHGHANSCARYWGRPASGSGRERGVTAWMAPPQLEPEPSALFVTVRGPREWWSAWWSSLSGEVVAHAA